MSAPIHIGTGYLPFLQNEVDRLERRNAAAHREIQILSMAIERTAVEVKTLKRHRLIAAAVALVAVIGAIAAVVA